MRLIFLLTDFGTSDTYVAQMKAAVLRTAPVGTSIVDLTHDIEAGSVMEGAFHLYVSRHVISPGSVVVAVVDPGVGTERQGVVCEVDGIYYVGPDNGLFGLLRIKRAWKLQRPPAESSTTFHGRDLFAPAGARLLFNPGWVNSLESIDPGILVSSEIRLSEEDEEGFHVTVAHIDRFGNVVLWLSPADADGFHPSEIRLPEGGIVPVTRTRTYGTRQGLLFLAGSQGCMELAVSCGRASSILGVSAGDRIFLKRSFR
ncbi:MAG: SAM-dependent chlorinase/fluorinase [Candidatus Aegiribacteria sp.]|nr:SAM-dependent chlorinase/fluorinase [Candidatus Aegiribacteria sp.]